MNLLKKKPALLNEFEVIDYYGEAQERSTDQFREKQVFQKYLQLNMLGKQELQEVMRQLVQDRTLDIATGENLDVIGRIVGRDRASVDITGIPLFGFIGALFVGGMGDTNNDGVGVRMKSLGESTSGYAPIDDDTYRIFLKARIMANTTNTTGDQFIAYIKFVFGVDKVQLQEGTASVTVAIGRKLSDSEKLLIQLPIKNGETGIIVKPAGVNVHFQDFPINFFAFQGVPGANGLGDYGNPNVGGNLSDLFA